MNSDINLSLTKEETQIVLNALVQMPFHAVAALVQKVQQQAQACVAQQENTDA